MVEKVKASKDAEAITILKLAGAKILADEKWSGESASDEIYKVLSLDVQS